MDKVLSPKQAAYNILKNNVNCSISLDELLNVIKSYGFDVIDYESKKKTSVDTLIRELELESFAETGKAFTYQKDDVNLVFVCDSMDTNEKMYALAHELGHIVCGHLKNGSRNKVNMIEEYEANEFAHYLFHPNSGIRFKQWIARHKAISWITVIVLILAIATILISKYCSISKSYYGEYYISESGEKYHRKECLTIKDRSNVHRMTIEEFDSRKYESCQICLPDVEQ